MTSHDVSVRGIGAGGFGVGSLPDGKTVFIPRAAPGDRVAIRVVKEKKNWARGEIVRILEEGPGRRKPPCPKYSRCDGCALQHLEYQDQLKWKGRVTGDALRRVGGLQVDDPPVVPSPEQIRYRNKATFTLRRLPGDRCVSGLRELGHRGRVLDIGAECLLPDEPIIQVWDGLRENWGPNAGDLPEGRELRLTLRSGENGVGLLVRGGRGDGDPSALISTVPGLIAIWREAKDGTVRHLAGEVALELRWGGNLITLQGGGFVQVNRGAGELLLRYIMDRAGEVRGRGVVDAYCGLGTLGRALAREGGDVVGIDIDPGEGSVLAEGDAFPGDAEDGEAQAPEGVFRAVKGRVEKELKRLLPVDLLILNPPRSGLEKSLPPILADRVSDRVLYVSCDPATLARDLRAMGRAYDLEEVRCFDLFPQTSHVETVVTLRKRNG